MLYETFERIYVLSLTHRSRYSWQLVCRVSKLGSFVRSCPLILLPRNQIISFYIANTYQAWLQIRRITTLLDWTLLLNGLPCVICLRGWTAAMPCYSVCSSDSLLSDLLSLLPSVPRELTPISVNRNVFTVNGLWIFPVENVLKRPLRQLLNSILPWEDFHSGVAGWQKQMRCAWLQIFF